MDIASKCARVSLTIKCWPGRAKNKNLTEEVRIEKMASEGAWTQPLVDKAELKANVAKATALRKYFNTNTLPWDDKGGRVILAKKIMGFKRPDGTMSPPFRNGINEKIAEFNDRCSEFIGKYPLLKERAKIEQNNMYCASAYPSSNDLWDKFGVTFNIEPLPVLTDDFRQALTTEEIIAIESTITNKFVAAQKDIWMRLRERITNMHSRLSDTEAKFQNTLVTNLREVIDLIPDLNITQDPNLTSMADEVKDRLLRYEPDDLRQLQSLRQQVATDADELLKKMEGYC
jgi:hypothetical protein